MNLWCHAFWNQTTLVALHVFDFPERTDLYCKSHFIMNHTTLVHPYAFDLKINNNNKTAHKSCLGITLNWLIRVKLHVQESNYNCCAICVWFTKKIIHTVRVMFGSYTSWAVRIWSTKKSWINGDICLGVGINNSLYIYNQYFL